MANDISKIKTPDGVVHDLRDRQAVPFVGKNSGNTAQFVRYNSLSQRYEGGVNNHFMLTIPATTSWIQFSIELSLHDYNSTKYRYSKLLITGGHNATSPYSLLKLTATLIGNAVENVSNLSGISVNGKTDTSGKIYLYIVGDTNYKTLSVDNMLVADGIINTDISAVSISNYTDLPSDTIAATMQYNYNPMTTAYDMIVGGTNGAPVRLAKGSNGTFLGINSSGYIGWNAITPSLIGAQNSYQWNFTGSYSGKYLKITLNTTTYTMFSFDVDVLWNYSRTVFSVKGYNYKGQTPRFYSADVSIKFGTNSNVSYAAYTGVDANDKLWVAFLLSDGSSNHRYIQCGIFNFINGYYPGRWEGAFDCEIVDSIPTASSSFTGISPVKSITYFAPSNPTNAWTSLGGKYSGFALAIGRWQSSPPEWTSGEYSSSLVFGGSDTKGMLGLSYYSPTVTFGGGSIGASTDAAPYWYFKIGAANGQTYLFPTTSKTLAASDGSNASGTWKIDVLPFNSGASGITSADSAWVTTTGQNKVYDNQSNKKWIWGARYTSSGWSNSDTGDMRFWLYGDSAGQWLNMNLDGYYFSIKGFIGDSSSATVGLSTAPMYAGYFTNLSANKITATELYGDSIKAALGDYNGVVTYNADTGALDVNTTAAYDAWGKTSGGALYAPCGSSEAASMTSLTGTYVLATNVSQVFRVIDDTTTANQLALIGHSGLRYSFSGTAAANATSYSYSSNYGFQNPAVISETPKLWSDIKYMAYPYNSTVAAKPSSVTVNSDHTVTLTFASSLNPTSTATALLWGNTADSKSPTFLFGVGLYSKGQNSVVVGMLCKNEGNNSFVLGQMNYNGIQTSMVLGLRNYNMGAYSAVFGSENVNKVASNLVAGKGHDVESSATGAVIGGQYSSVSSTTAFAIGNGTDFSARSNAFEVSTAGVVTSSRTTTSSLGTLSAPWHHTHTNGLTIYEAGEVGLPFEGDGFLKYDNDNGLYLDTAVYLPKSGGTVTGALTFGASSADNRKLVPSANATGYVGTSSVRWGAGYFNALYCGSSNTNVASKLSDHESRISALEAGTCLIEGTKILMADNSEKSIEDVKEGDLIMSYDPNTNKLCEAVVIGNYKTGISNDFTNYYFEDGSYLTIFGGHLVYNAKQGIARHVKHFEPGWTSITPECKETAFIGSENIDNVGHKRHYDLHSSNKLYFANGILNGQSLTLDYARYRDKDFPEEYLQALKADYDAGYNINKFKTDKEVGATLVPILKELKAQKKVMDDNKKRLADSDYLVAKFTEGLISAAEWLKAKAERAGWRGAVNKAEPLYAAAEERYNAFKAKYKAPNTKRERFNAAVARDNACLDALKAYYESKNEVSK